MNKALFLDRDGVINTRLVGQYVRTPGEFELILDIVPILKLAKERGYQLVLITNQQGIGKGLMSTRDLGLVHDHMQQSLQSAGALAIDAIYWCSDLDGSGSTHRKPAPVCCLMLCEITTSRPRHHGSWEIPAAMLRQDAQQV
jgi:D-glycero-D-manno-heptose 1,7-bisphosphate phosphatase